MEHQTFMARKASRPKFLLVACAILSFFLERTLAAEVMDKMVTTHPSQLINDQKRVVSQNNSFDGWSLVEITPSGNLSVHLGSALTLTCNIADSIPDLCFCWFFNDTKWANVTERRITIRSTSWDNEGTYTCCAHSPANNLTDCASTSVRITTDEGATLQLSAEAMVGAVFVLVAGTALLATLVYCVYSCIKRKNPPTGNAMPSVYEDLPMGPQIGSLVSKETKPETSPEDNTTYEVLQRGEEAIYQELEK